jgi:hypothetical protein
MLLPKSKLRLICAFAALATLALAASCRGFFVNPTVTSLAIGPSNLSLAPGQQFLMAATATFSDGSTSDATGKALWVSSDEAVASFPTPGELTAVSLTQLEAQGSLPGTTSVSASIGTVTSSSQTVNVCPVVQSLQITVNGSTTSYDGQATTVTFTATATFNGISTPQTVTDSVTWNIGNPTILPDITDGTGVLTADNANMPFTVTATLCGINSSNTLTITTTN